MKYTNANDVLPKELLSAIQTYYQGGYLYIPREADRRVKRHTDYKMELEKRNRHIYLKHLEGRTNGQIGNIYHLSESSIRRIIAKEKAGYQEMQSIIEEIVPLWGMENRQVRQIYSSAWEINHTYVIKRYDDKEQLERNIKILHILSASGIPVADLVPAKNGDDYAAYKDAYFLMSGKLRGSNIADIKDPVMAHQMGCAIARLHRAFIKCEKEMEFWDNSLLKEMRGWVRETLANNEWQMIGQEEYAETVKVLETVYDDLPKQLIHRDVHFGNFLFYERELSGYIDFDLSQRNIRIFDICYFLTGLLSEETDDAFTKKEWLESVKSVVAGYEGSLPLSEKEKGAIPCVMECIEMLCAAYFLRIKDSKRAADACHVCRFIQECENDICSAI